MKHIAYILVFLALDTLAVVKINDIQVLGSHNSFKRYMNGFIVSVITSVCELPDIGIPDYQHRPLTQQLDRGVRAFEFDIFVDREGGRYKEYKVMSTLGEDGNSYDAELEVPGFKVFHEPNIDFYVNCRLLTTCLRQLLDWSNLHPNHLPFLIQLETRSTDVAVLPGLDVSKASFLGVVPVVHFEAADLDALDAEVLSVIPMNKLILPDDVRGTYGTLREAVLAGNWPSLAASRGKFLIFLDPSSGVGSMYTNNHASLRGRPLFMSADPASDEAAVIKRDSPLLYQEIVSLVSQGFIVRTRADADSIEAILNETRPRDLALASGAHIISTDFIEPTTRYGNNYVVKIPKGNPGRCNPVRGGSCTSADVAE
ncbi:MAG: Ca2+-dependent phosphoinositide-specific phospholipase C [Myxococcota bacterium]